MEQPTIRVYRYRWVVLLAFMFVVAVNQLLWITFAPITGDAASFYQVSNLSIGLLSMSFMLVYILVSIPASWVIDTYGIRVGVGIGAGLTGLFGLLRGVSGSNYTWVLLTQIGIALGQPFILNAVTKVAARWFPKQERATAAGLGSLAMYLGIMAGMAFTPLIILNGTIQGMLIWYGITAVLAAGIFWGLVKERPPTPPCPPEEEARALVFDGLKRTLRQKDFLILLFVFFIGLGAFNSVTTWIEEILRPRGYSITQAGAVGGSMVIGGIIGALILPALSDHYQKRTPFMVYAVLGATLGLAGIIAANSYGWLLAASAVFGFFLLSAGPIGFQYGAEITYPAPEGTSNGLLLLMGQISGVLFIFGMDSLKSPSYGSMTFPMLILFGLMVIGFLASTRLKESDVFIAMG